jgi:hypothetical protein
MLPAIRAPPVERDIVTLDGESAWGQSPQITRTAGYVVNALAFGALEVVMVAGLRRFIPRAVARQRNHLHGTFGDQRLEIPIDCGEADSWRGCACDGLYFRGQ